LRQLEQRSRQEKQTQIFIETPYRNEAMLEAIANHCTSSTLLTVATDLTLATETVRTQPVQIWKNEMTAGRLPDFKKKPTVFLLLAI
jgi:16S rRNA (cytidine1402-2'-O)-methyltransferase